MKIILSRKGFDTAHGNCGSPILPDGTLLSMPIPSDDKLAYDGIAYRGMPYDKLLEQLYPKKNYHCCHLDPDIREGVRIEPIDSWMPAFGPTHNVLGILRNAGVKVGDLFLFFGLFCKTEEFNGSIRFMKREKPLQIIYGYLQVGKILDKSEEIANYQWHPHASGNYDEQKNALYLPSDKLNFCPSLPGYGILSYRENRVLTKPNENNATWKEHRFLNPENLLCSKRKNSSTGGGLYYKGQWQELVLKESEEANKWALELIT